jgi:hypothetical protein
MPLGVRREMSFIRFGILTKDFQESLREAEISSGFIALSEAGLSQQNLTRNQVMRKR